MGYNGGAVVAMVGKDCVAIASDLRFGVKAQTVAGNMPKVCIIMFLFIHTTHHY